MLNYIIKKLFSLSRLSKVIIQMLTDALLIVFCFSLAIYLRLDGITYFYNQNLILFFLIIIALSLFLFFRLGFYNKIIRYISDKIIFNLTLGTLGSTFFVYFLTQILDIFLPRSIPFIYFTILLTSMIGIRFFLKTFFLYISMIIENQ